MQRTALLDQTSQGSSVTWAAAGSAASAQPVPSFTRDAGWGVLSTPSLSSAVTPCQEAEDSDLWFAERTADV
ncbi:hypothetical protein NL459_28295, partial [Klebsiella pneumoniae]|nr:hypothetical protein [Klebsiella pneumoniae]